MRNPERIDKVVDAVKEAWKTVPDWRLGQLIVNISRTAGKMNPFFLEDDDLLAVLGVEGKADAVENERSDATVTTEV